MIEALVAFLEARLGEDEALARAATPGPWRYNPGKQWLQIEPKALRDAAARAGVEGEEFVGTGPLDATVGVAATGPADDPQSIADAAFIARNDPARELAEVAFKRRLLDEYLLAELADDEATFDGVPGILLREFAAVWSEHRDYRAEWRPA